VAEVPLPSDVRGSHAVTDRACQYVTDIEDIVIAETLNRWLGVRVDAVHADALVWGALELPAVEGRTQVASAVSVGEEAEEALAAPDNVVVVVYLAVLDRRSVLAGQPLSQVPPHGAGAAGPRHGLALGAVAVFLFRLEYPAAALAHAVVVQEHAFGAQEALPEVPRAVDAAGYCGARQAGLEDREEPLHALDAG